VACGYLWVNLRLKQTVSLTRFWTLFLITKARTGTPGGVLDSDKKVPGEPKIRTEIQMLTNGHFVGLNLFFSNLNSAVRFKHLEESSSSIPDIFLDPTNSS
jgi:hypothetical protein